MELGLNTIVTLIVVMIVLLVVMLYFTGGAKSTFEKMKGFGKIATGASDDVSAGIGGIVADCPPGTYTSANCDNECGAACECKPQGTKYICVGK